ncbi:MAG: hypothetical protein DME19_10830 [Verrucomicrobia bacterium]|nr:MAG: hypothetical protein DME19_10830 [Verrucomicrobiota bacterium]
MNGFYTDTLLHLLSNDLVRRDMRILVVCGGEHDKQALEHSGFRNVTISNLDARMNGKEFAPFTWSFQDAEKIAFRDNEFDFCIVHDGLHHCRSPHRALLEMYRVARCGLLVFEPRDSLVARLGLLLNFSQEYEVSGISWNEFTYGGVQNTEIPNHVYRWTEREVKKTISSFAPWGRHEYLFFYRLRVPWMRLRALRNKLWLTAAYAALPFLRLFTWIFPKQCNNFAFAVFKPAVPQNLHPWIEHRDGEFRINRPWLQKRYR